MPGPRALLIIAGLATVTILVLPFHAVLLRLRHPARKATARLWHRIACRLMGLRVTVHGAAAGHGVLLVANHVSWLDILALGAVAPVSFVAKQEVRGWPVFGWLARLQECQFVSRETRLATGDQAGELAARLASGDTMVLFAEGTTSCGNFVQTFKSSLFGALGIGGEGERRVQPVAIAYVGVDGMPMGRRMRPLAAWPGDVELGPHLSRILREGRIDIRVVFGEVETAAAGADRKALARHMEGEVRAMVSQALRGRLAPSQGGAKPVKAAP